jgi:hypothetical protein
MSPPGARTDFFFKVRFSNPGTQNQPRGESVLTVFNKIKNRLRIHSEQQGIAF